QRRTVKNIHQTGGAFGGRGRRRRRHVRSASRTLLRKTAWHGIPRLRSRYKGSSERARECSALDPRGGVTDDVVGCQPQMRTNAPLPIRSTFNSTGFGAAAAMSTFMVPIATSAKAKRGRPPKNPNAPKRARTDYMFFVQAHRARHAGSAVKPRAAIRAAAREWRQLSEEGQTPYRQMARDDKARYEAERAQQLNGP
ncbi:HMG-box, partial [Aphelenchoides avenae]